MRLGEFRGRMVALSRVSCAHALIKSTGLAVRPRAFRPWPFASALTRSAGI